MDASLNQVVYPHELTKKIGDGGHQGAFDLKQLSFSQASMGGSRRGHRGKSSYSICPEIQPEVCRRLQGQLEETIFI